MDRKCYLSQWLSVLFWLAWLEFILLCCTEQNNVVFLLYSFVSCPCVRFLFICLFLFVVEENWKHTCLFLCGVEKCEFNMPFWCRCVLHCTIQSSCKDCWIWTRRPSWHIYAETVSIYIWRPCGMLSVQDGKFGLQIRLPWKAFCHYPPNVRGILGD